MRASNKLAIMCSFAVVIFCITVVLMYKNGHQKIAKYKQHTKEVYSDIQFKGKVLKIHKIERGGRVYGMMCIKLDYANIDSFYRFDKMSCLKICNSIVSLPTGSISIENDRHVRPILNATYIEVNMDNSNQRVFIDSSGNRTAQDLYYQSSNLKEVDLQLCDECK